MENTGDVYIEQLSLIPSYILIYPSQKNHYPFALLGGSTLGLNFRQSRLFSSNLGMKAASPTALGWRAEAECCLWSSLNFIH